MYNPTVPSSPPQNIRVIIELPGSLHVSWQPPPEIDQNGPLVGYVIRLAINATGDMVGSGGEINETITGRLTYILNGLSLLINYSVQVAAITVNGTGPFSAAVLADESKHTKQHPKGLFVTTHVNTFLHDVCLLLICIYTCCHC